MSLRAFHVLFVVASILLCVAMAVWGVRQHLAAGSGGLGLAVAGAAGAVALLVYASRVFGKLGEAEERE